MLAASRERLPQIAVGDTVAVPIPAVDRSVTDARNILAVVISITDDD